MNKIDLIDRDSGLEYKIEPIEEFCLKLLDALEIDNWEFSVLFCDDDYMTELNDQYRNKKEPTDVLTFCDADTGGSWNAVVDNDSPYYAGDVVISVETLIKNSELFKVDTVEELKRLLLHGILHLKGMDHKTNNDDEAMLRLQESILKDFGDYLF